MRIATAPFRFWRTSLTVTIAGSAPYAATSIDLPWWSGPTAIAFTSAASLVVWRLAGPASFARWVKPRLLAWWRRWFVYAPV